MHAWLVYRREVTRTPFRALAAEMDLPKSTVQKFYARKTYPQKIWPKLRDWYLEDPQMKRTEYETPPKVMVMSAIRSLAAVPNAARPKLIQQLAATYREIYVSERLPVPRWVDMLERTGEIAAQAPEPPEEFEYLIPEGDRSDS